VVRKAVLAAALASAAGWSPAHAQATVKLLQRAQVRDAPAGDPLGTLAARRPITGAPTVVPLLARASAAGTTWLRVRLPQRPNGSSGWITADGTVTRRARLEVVVDRSRRRAWAYLDGSRVRGWPVVVGRPETPTPTGHFFVTERVRQPRGSPLGPWVLATSAYSGVLRQFGGGPGQVGLHGRSGLRAPLGSAASHGCVRFSDRSIAWLARRARAGTAVTVRR
jgi:lipoprotein-anchoring transpeptidase ErfK/SrfK